MSVADDVPLLLIHGFAQTAQSWQSVIEIIADRRQTHAIELPGHGATALNVGQPSVENVRAFLVAELDRIGSERAVIWGYSQGARCALDLALSSPRRVAALILESGTAGIEDAIARADRRSRDNALASRLEAGTIDQFVDLWEQIPALTGQSAELIAAQRAGRLSHDPRALAAALRGIGQAAYEPMWDRLPLISVPALVLSGERDKIYSALATRIAAQIPGAVHKTITGAGHSVHLEVPNATVDAVTEFLARAE